MKRLTLAHRKAISIGLKGHFAKIPPIIDSVELHTMYIKQKLSSIEIAKRLHCSDSYIRSLLRRYKIQIRKSWDPINQQKRRPSYGMLGKHHSKQSRWKISLGHKGMIPWNKGKTKYNDKRLVKMSLIKIGTTRIFSKKHRKNISKARKGIKFSKEHLMNMSKASKKVWRTTDKKEFARTRVLNQIKNGLIPKSNTKIERIVKKELLKRGLKENKDFFHQYIFKNVLICDFAFPKKKLIVECDGDYWHANPKIYNKNKLNKTQLRNKRFEKYEKRKLKECGWTLLRFWESDIKNDSSRCINKIISYLKKV